MPGIGLVSRLARSPAAARVLFGLRLERPLAGERLFDASTLALVRAARGRVERGARVLEVGTGGAALLAGWLERALGCRVVATEIDRELAARAAGAVHARGGATRVVAGAFLAGERGPFDWLVANPPYVPSERGLARGLPPRFRTQWDGGPDGTRTLSALLRALEREPIAARALIGLNRRHVPRELAARRLAEHEGLALEERVAHPWLPVDVYVLRSRKGPSASASSPLE